ncbi:MAG: putative toxin-antitoxin system toxin component, PIN family [Rhodobacteraceae bacterium]|nr:putative toxin-antitoxin system toxin component, PIN family [Paracoccaceae bacterium]
MRLVLDTNVLVAGARSRAGASNPLLIAGFRGGFRWCCSVPLFYEYEDVLNRAEFLLETGITRDEIGVFLTDIAGTVTPVDLHFLWRPQLRDPGDEMVLETAVNARAVAIVTHNARDFGTAPGRFGIEVLSPAEALKRIAT